MCCSTQMFCLFTLYVELLKLPFCSIPIFTFLRMLLFKFQFGPGFMYLLVVQLTNLYLFRKIDGVSIPPLFCRSIKISRNWLEHYLFNVYTLYFNKHQKKTYEFDSLDELCQLTNLYLILISVGHGLLVGTHSLCSVI